MNRAPKPPDGDATLPPTDLRLDADATLPPSNNPADATLPPSPQAAGSSPPAIGQQSRCFGDYELLEEVARGGMGVVYKARQQKLNRIVAVKMILDRNLARPEDVQRFYCEAQAVARLDHPGIVSVHEVGEIDGQHFFSMEFVEGGSLADLVRAQPLPARRAAELIETIARTMQYAHEQGVIHRDLKPSNILLQKAEVGRMKEEAAGSGGAPGSHSSSLISHPFPKITDFGLARQVSGSDGLTATGQVLGTPGYMPPEQAGARTDQIGPASDVYSLGAILYEMLTGRPPFQGETPLDIVMQVLENDPVPPRLLNPNVPRDLETICLKCLQKPAHLRYATAGELADDVRRFREDLPIQATSVNLLSRMTRALTRSQNAEHFRAWGLALVLFGVIILVAHAAIFILDSQGLPPLWAYWLPRSVMFGAILLVLWRSRSQSMLPTNAVERPIWAVWIGYLLALAASNTVLWLRGEDAHALYATSALLCGLCFYIMGSFVWGGCYAIGIGFLCLAPVLAIVGDSAALWFGLMWGICLVLLGEHYRRLSRD